MFLPILNLPENPLKSSQNTTVCIKAGAIKANTDDATAPISDMKSSIFGMAAARATALQTYIKFC